MSIRHNRSSRENILANRTLSDFEDLRPIVASYIREVRERQKELA